MNNLENEIFSQIDNIAEKAGDFDKIRNGIAVRESRRPVKYKALVAIACSIAVLCVSVGTFFQLTQNHPEVLPPVTENATQTPSGISPAATENTKQSVPKVLPPIDENARIICKEQDQNSYYIGSIGGNTGGPAGSSGEFEIPDNVVIIEKRPDGYSRNISDLLAYLLDQEEDENTLFRIEMSYNPEDLYYNVKVDGNSVFDVYKEIVKISEKEESLPITVYSELIWTNDVNATTKAGSYTPLEWIRKAGTRIVAFSEINTEEKFKEYATNGYFAKIFPGAKKIADWYYSNESNPKRAPEWINDLLTELKDDIQERAYTLMKKHPPMLRELGFAMREAQIKAAEKIFVNRDLQYDPWNINYSDRFVVTMSKKEVLEYAETNSDMRFWNVGVKERPKDAPDKFSSELALTLAEMKDNELIDVSVVYSDCEFLSCYQYFHQEDKDRLDELSEKYDEKYGQIGEEIIFNNNFYNKVYSDLDFSHGFIYDDCYYNRFYSFEKQLTKSEVLNFIEDANIIYTTLAPSRAALDGMIGSSPYVIG